MQEAERQTRSHLMVLFERHGLNPRHALGQNFLIDLNLVEYIANKAELGPNDVVLEVGSGTGGLTTFLAQKAGSVISVEVDKKMFKLVSETTQAYDNVILLNTDALKNKNRYLPVVLDTIEQELAKNPERRLKLVANLPYSVATPIISNLVATELPWIRIVVTIQLELAQRMIARPGRSTYGALSVWLQSQCQVEILKKMGRKVFWPRPKVNSAIVKVVPKPSLRKRIANREFYHDYLRRLFHHRRKLLRSVSVGMYRKQIEKSAMDEILKAQKLKSTARAEEVTVRQHIELGNRIYAATLDVAAQS